MCGIVGIYSNESQPEEFILKEMTQTLAHRGPDASGIFIQDKCGLGHRRLSIVDLSDSANQPMTSHCGRYVMVYNGEVYNFKELTEKLCKPFVKEDVVLKTTSDTEIILELFSNYGENFVQLLNGMFAIAIFDKSNHTLHLFRDRIGIKPLFYSWNGKTLIFASEMKAILKALKTKPSINTNSICNYLTLGFIPAPHTIFNTIYKLQPATHLKIQGAELTKREFWSLTENLKPEKQKDLYESKAVLDGLIRDSVKIQLRSDVSNGVFLSSGIDSSLITTKAVQVSTKKIKTFTLGFIDNQNDESKHASIIAKHLGTEHHEIIIKEKEAIESLQDALKLYEEPNSDASIIPTYLLSKFASESISVALSGEGADELFLGYGRYRWAKRLDSKPARIIGNAASLVFSKMASKYKRVGKLLETGKSRNLVHHIFSQESYNFNEEELFKLLKPEILAATAIRNSSSLPDFENPFTKRHDLFENKNIELIDKQSIFDQLYYLPDNLLTKIDRATMKNSLEARVPFLDHRIIEFALNLDNNLKIRNSTSKFLLKEILFDDLPSKLFERPKKGFSIPLKKWLKTDMKFLINDCLNEKAIAETSIFNYKTVEKLIRDYLNGQDYLVIRIWGIIVLQHWLIDNKSNYTN